MAKRGESAAELARPLPRRLCRELSLLAPTAGDGPKFAAISAAASSAVSAALPIDRGVPPPAALIAEIVRDFDVAVLGTDWHSEMEQAGHLAALESARTALLRGVLHSVPPAHEPLLYARERPMTARDAANRAIDGMAILQARLARASEDEIDAVTPLLRQLRAPNRLDALEATRMAAEMVLAEYTPPIECWALIAEYLPACDARSFAACAHWTNALVAPRWQRMVVRGEALARIPRMVLPADRYRSVRRVVFDFKQRAPAPAAAAAIADLVLACRAPSVRMFVSGALELTEGEWSRAPIPNLTLTATRESSRRTGVRDVCAKLAAAFDLSTLRTLRLRGDFFANYVPTSLLCLPGLETVCIDARNLKLLTTIPLAQLCRLPLLRLRDRDGRFSSPLDAAHLAALLAPQQLWCETAGDCAIAIDALAHANALDKMGVDADGVSMGFLLSRLYYGRREPERVVCAKQLDLAQHEYFLLDANENEAANDFWFRQCFPSLPLARADE